MEKKDVGSEHYIIDLFFYLLDVFKYHNCVFGDNGCD